MRVRLIAAATLALEAALVGQPAPRGAAAPPARFARQRLSGPGFLESLAGGASIVSIVEGGSVSVRLRAPHAARTTAPRGTTSNHHVGNCPSPRPGPAGRRSGAGWRCVCRDSSGRLGHARLARTHSRGTEPAASPADAHDRRERAAAVPRRGHGEHLEGAHHPRTPRTGAPRVGALFPAGRHQPAEYRRLDRTRSWLPAGHRPSGPRSGLFWRNWRRSARSTTVEPPLRRRRTCRIHRPLPTFRTPHADRLLRSHECRSRPRTPDPPVARPGEECTIRSITP